MHAIIHEQPVPHEDEAQRECRKMWSNWISCVMLPEVSTLIPSIVKAPKILPPGSCVVRF